MAARPHAHQAHQPAHRTRRPRRVATPLRPGLYRTWRQATVRLLLCALLDILVITLGIAVCAGLMWWLSWPPLPPFYR